MFLSHIYYNDVLCIGIFIVVIVNTYVVRCIRCILVLLCLVKKFNFVVCIYDHISFAEFLIVFKGTHSADAHAHFTPFLSWFARFAYHKTRA